jgi:hypothetical protein
MGYAYGKLMKEEIVSNLGGFLEYAKVGIDALMEEYMIPAFIRVLINKNVFSIVDYLLELNW